MLHRQQGNIGNPGIIREAFQLLSIQGLKHCLNRSINRSINLCRLHHVQLDWQDILTHFCQRLTVHDVANTIFCASGVLRTPHRAECRGQAKPACCNAAAQSASLPRITMDQIAGPALQPSFQNDPYHPPWAQLLFCLTQQQVQWLKDQMRTR